MLRKVTGVTATAKNQKENRNVVLRVAVKLDQHTDNQKVMDRPLVQVTVSILTAQIKSAREKIAWMICLRNQYEKIIVRNRAVWTRRPGQIACMDMQTLTHMYATI